jgi:hypothetical protein
MAQEAVVKNILNVPKAVPGQDMAEFVRRSDQWYKNVVTYTDTTVVNLFQIPGNCVVVGGFVRVTTPFDATGTSGAATITLTVPNDTGTEVIFDAGALGLTTTGFKPATGFAATPDTGGFIICNLTPNTTTAGVAEVYVQVVQLADMLG